MIEKAASALYATFEMSTWSETARHPQLFS